MFSTVRAFKPRRMKVSNAFLQSRASFADEKDAKKKLETVLLESLKMQPIMVQRLISLKTYLNRMIGIPAYVLERNWKLLQKYNIKLDNPCNISSSLSIRSNILENRIMLLQELGVTNVTVDMIRGINKFINLDENSFKSLCNVPSHQRIMENLLRYANPTPNELAFHNNVEPITDVQRFQNETVYEQYTHCLKHYKHWKFGCTDRSKKYRLVKCISFQYASRVVRKLHEVGITIDFYHKHPYLLNVHIDDVNRVISSFKDTSILGIDIMELIKLYPKIFLLEPDNVRALLEVLEEYKMTQKSIKCCYDILTLQKDEFLRRINELKTIPELNLWRNHARVTYLIYHFESVKKRLNLVRDTNMAKWANLYTYTTSNSYFMQYSQGMHNSLPGKYLKYIFESELNRSDDEILVEFKKHPNYINVPIARIVQTIRYLKQHYSLDDICKNIHLVLYHRASIENTLKHIYTEYSSMNGYHYTTCQRLALCLYMLEKDRNFSGAGVWDVEEYDADMNEVDEDGKPFYETNKDNVYVQLMSNFNKSEIL